jgi:hypothetical protein
MRIMNHPLRCQCGTLRGQVSQPEKATRIVCYCKDCQAFARFLGKPDVILDELGGSDILAVHPQTVTFTEGQQALACMSLSPSGMLRWYASCCNTPIGNTSRDPRMAYVGLSHSCLEKPGSSISDVFGPVRMRAMTKGAKGPVEASALASARTIAGIAVSVIAARLSGSYKRTPFFDVANGTPVAAPRVLTPQERERLSA